MDQTTRDEITTYTRLTATRCGNAPAAEKVYYLPDRGEGSVRGLRLCVRPNGAKLWMLRFTLPGTDGIARESTHGLGRFPDVSLAQARDKAKQARDDASEGKHPTTARRARVARNVEAGARTFDVVTEQWLSHGERHGFGRKGPWSAHHVERNAGLARRFLSPKLGKLPVSEITEPLVLDILREAYEAGTRESARRSAVVARQIMGFAKGRRYIATNPLASILDDAQMPKPIVEGFAALPTEQVGPMLRALAESGLEPVTRAALILMLFTGLRDASLRGARWTEIDYATATWTVPAERMKSRREHKVPLPTQAVAVLEHLAQLTDNKPDAFIFASTGKAGFLAENTLRVALHRLGFKVTAHGIRSLLTDKLNLAGFNADAIERQLDHVQKDKVRAAYLRTDFMEQRRTMMQWFADWCEAERNETAAPPTPNKLVALRRVA